jgi:Protein of unknown function VcgC/VcgE (DUF2780)
LDLFDGSCFAIESIGASHSLPHEEVQHPLETLFIVIMDKLLQEQNAQEGTSNLSLDQLKDALGGILSFLKSKLGDSFDFSKVSDVIPEADELVNKAETENSRAGPSGGAADLMNSAMSMFGGGGAAPAPAADGAAPAAPAPIDSMTQLLGYLTKAGIDPNQIMQFLPVVAKFLKDNAGVDVSSALPVGTTPAPAPAEGGDAAAAPAPAADGTKDVMDNIMGQASSFMGSFKK